MLYAVAAGERAMKIQEVIVRALSGAITWLQAADILGLEPRSVRRWRARYEAGGHLALYDRRTQRPSRRKAPLRRCNASCACIVSASPAGTSATSIASPVGTTA